MNVAGKVHAERIHEMRKTPEYAGPVLYWMSRDQRARDNWALLHAAEIARDLRQPLAVVFCLVSEFEGASRRHFRFLLEGLREVDGALRAKNIPFFLLEGVPEKVLPSFVESCGAACVVTDFDPLPVKQKWRRRVADRIKVGLVEVDAHNIVPCRRASDKREYAAYTLRPKIARLRDEFLIPFPKLTRQETKWEGAEVLPDWEKVLRGCPGRDAGPAITWCWPGEEAGRRRLRGFVREKLATYPETSRDPSLDGLSGFSPYLHFGQLSAQRVALEVLSSGAPEVSREAFLEELIVRRELSDNYCLYNPDCESLSSIPDWARKTLDEHRSDPRTPLYRAETFAGAETHDPLWNAAQSEMVLYGKMHGFMRMYWAKKILEWSRSPEEAFEIAMTLNDCYELDGRDPNGIVGVAWAIGGVHDRAWTERPVFGKIRYMNEKGCRRKFDVDRYIRRVGAGLGESRGSGGDE